MWVFKSILCRNKENNNFYNKKIGCIINKLRWLLYTVVVQCIASHNNDHHPSISHDTISPLYNNKQRFNQHNSSRRRFTVNRFRLVLFRLLFSGCHSPTLVYDVLIKLLSESPSAIIDCAFLHGS